MKFFHPICATPQAITFPQCPSQNCGPAGSLGHTKDRDASSASRGTRSPLSRICLSPAVLVGNAEHDTVSYGHCTPCAKPCLH